MRPVSAILLAAGKGTRSGRFKPLLQWNGESFISKVFRSMTESNEFREIIVVTGFQSSLLQIPLGSMAARSVFNPDYEKGIHSSIKTGLRTLRQGWSGALIAHVDQPQLESRDYLKIIHAFIHSTFSLIRPCFKGEPGNPAILGVGYLKEIEDEPGADYGCAYLFNRHPEDVLFVEMDDPGCTRDFDVYP